MTFEKCQQPRCSRLQDQRKAATRERFHGWRAPRPSRPPAKEESVFLRCACDLIVSESTGRATGPGATSRTQRTEIEEEQNGLGSRIFSHGPERTCISSHDWTSDDIIGTIHGHTGNSSVFRDAEISFYWPTHLPTKWRLHVARKARGKTRERKKMSENGIASKNAINDYRL